MADVEEAKNLYPEVGYTLSKAEHVTLNIKRLNTLLPGMRMIYTVRSEGLTYWALEEMDADEVFSAQSSVFTMSRYSARQWLDCESSTGFSFPGASSIAKKPEYPHLSQTYLTGMIQPSSGALDL